MAENVDLIDSVHWKLLRKPPDNHLDAADREEKGRLYSPVLRDLQIRPDQHEIFFHDNVRPFRNKKNSNDLIAKGDEHSILTLSKNYLTAYGSIVWGKRRGWLLNPTELSDGEEPLKYIQPKDRKEGDHDRFYEILQELWKSMRSAIFEVKPSALSKDNAHGSIKGSFAAPAPKSLRISQSTRGQEAHPRKRRAIESSDPYEVSPLGKWPASKTEQTILDAITDIHEARCQSHPEVFTRLWERHMARLYELAQAEESHLIGERQLTVSVGDSSAAESTAQSEHVTNTSNDDAVAMDVKAGRTTANTYQEGSTKESIATKTGSYIQSKADLSGHALVSKSEKKADKADEPTDQGQKQEKISSKNSDNRSVNTKTNISFSDQHRATSRPQFPMTAYLPPTLPQVMTVYVTPFSHTARSGQPYIWPDAPVHPTSYIGLRHGIRLRANIPDRVHDDRLMLVLGYGWNDFCCVVRNEEGWKNWFMNDLRTAAKGGVDVWIMRVCCFAS